MKPGKSDSTFLIPKGTFFYFKGYYVQLQSDAFIQSDLLTQLGGQEFLDTLLAW
jgi:hypothetical protein